MTKIEIVTPLESKVRDGCVVLDAVLLKNLRRMRGYSQAMLYDLCAEKRLYISLSSIKRAEASKPVLYRTALQLAIFYKVNVDKLISSSLIQSEFSTILEQNISAKVEG